ncbi:MAG: riboflavin synthase, partial [Candidatus Dormibacteraceae bacterium]
LELPLRLNQGLDGHLVQGHVDAMTEVLTVEEVALGREVSFRLPPELAVYVAQKGSITVDGVSLTVAGLSEGSFRIGLIPHTLERTVSGTYRPGYRVNLEVDVIARYVERLTRAAS